MMVHDKWWQNFLHRKNLGASVQSYVKTGKAPPKEASTILFYVTKPVGEIAGYAEFIERKVGKSDQVWQEHGSECVLESKRHFDEFISDSPNVSFIRFKNLRKASKPVSLDNLLLFLGSKRLPRAGFFISEENAEKLIALMD